MKVVLAQFNATVGDLSGNARRIAQIARQAHADGARLVVAPELALSGYPPEDLLLRPAFMQACREALQGVASDLGGCMGCPVGVGPPHPLGGRGSSTLPSC